VSYDIKLNSLYICVKDIDRAINFYEKILKQKAQKNFPNFIISGIRFCMYDFKKINDTVVFGDNCLPSFEVNDIEDFMKQLSELNAVIVMPLTRIGDNWVLEFKDTEGNDIEVYSKWYPLVDGPFKDYIFY
jgi:predicted enzyme related to lactoylglutathione lyase